MSRPASPAQNVSLNGPPPVSPPATAQPATGPELRLTQSAVAALQDAGRQLEELICATPSVPTAAEASTAAAAVEALSKVDGVLATPSVADNVHVAPMDVLVYNRTRPLLEDDLDPGFRGDAFEQVWKPKDAGESLGWYGSSDDDEAPRAAGVRADYPYLKPGPNQPGHRIWRVHLSASRIAMWLGLDSFGWDGRCKGSATGRQRLINEWITPRERTKVGRPNPRLERGKQHEPLTRKLFAEIAGLEIGVDITKAPLVEHPQHPYLAAKADGLIGDKGVLEIKTPWAARDHDEPVELEIKHLLQVMLQLECYDREYAIVVMSAGRGEWLHVWRINRDFPAAREPGTPSLFELCLPEFAKYKEAIENGGELDRMTGGTTDQTLSELRKALKLWSSYSVFKLGLEDAAVHEETIDRWPRLRLAGWVAANIERATKPAFTVIDGVQRPEDGPRIEKTRGFYRVRRFTRIWWRHQADGTPYVYHHPRDAGPVSGGYIRPEYYHALLDNPEALKTRALWLPVHA